jgi:DHA1 family bicyclomycin/chloramphenicol resistance-like MFS transporter
MELFKDNQQRIRTILAFALIPLSGFATDIYIPSLPAMANQLHVTSSAVQLSLVVFMLSSGVSQLFVGSLLDSYGRYRIGIGALIIFTAASFVIAISANMNVIYLMRILQGITVALIVVGKRAYFMDTYSGEKLKGYTSLFSIVWATAPILAPFLGGYLEAKFGWRSNFMFLGVATFILLLLEIKYSRESLKNYQIFRVKEIWQIYRLTFKTTDFSIGIIIISLSYAMLGVYGMSSPFIIEHVFRFSPVVTGYCSLISGVSLMTGGIISKILIRKSLNGKLLVAMVLQLIAACLMIFTHEMMENLFTLMAFTIIVHLLSGFLFNNVFSYCLGRFSKHAGIASGITGGSLFILSSLFSYITVNILVVRNQEILGIAYLSFSFLNLISFIFFRRYVSRTIISEA